MKKIIIEGMQCGNCANLVQGALSEVTGVNHIQVNLQDNNAIVDLFGIVQNEILQAVVERVGFRVTDIIDL